MSINSINSLDGGVKIQILVVGATGQLGAHIVRSALKEPRLQVNVLVRDPTKNKELVQQVEEAGGKVIKGDLTDHESLKDVTQGMHTVISTVAGGDDKVAIDGQKALIDDCVKNEVRRFVPSDFGLDYTLINREELLASHITAYKVIVEDYLKTVKLPLLRFYTGALTETFCYILSQGKNFWGDENLKHNLTSYENTARFVVSALTVSSLTGKLTYSGGEYTIKEVQDIYNKVRGADIKLTRAGSLQDLKGLVELKKHEGDSQTAGFLALLLLLFDARSKFIVTDNKAFSDVKPTSLEEFLTENPNVQI